MSALTDAFDEWLEIVQLHYAQSIPDYEVAANPGASDELIAEVEQQLGFALAPEARELYQHANGLTRKDTAILPWRLSFDELNTQYVDLSLIHI